MCVSPVTGKTGVVRGTVLVTASSTDNHNIKSIIISPLSPRLNIRNQLHYPKSLGSFHLKLAFQSLKNCALFIRKWRDSIEITLVCQIVSYFLAKKWTVTAMAIKRMAGFVTVWQEPIKLVQADFYSSCWGSEPKLCFLQQGRIDRKHLRCLQSAEENNPSLAFVNSIFIAPIIAPR